MNFFKRLAMLVYMLLMVVTGAIFLVVALNVFSSDQIAGWLGVVEGASGYQITLGVIGCLFVLIGLIAPCRLERRLKKNRVIAFRNPDGDVQVSLSAIEEYIRKIAKGIPGIKDVSSRVDISRKGIDITTGVSISASANIPEITEKIQSEVKSRVHSMLGVEEAINMTMHIKKISRGADERPAEGIPGGGNIPYREME